MAGKRIRSEVCELYIEQEIQDALSQGKRPYQIGQEISNWVVKLFEAKIPADTIRKRAERAKKIGTNVQDNATSLIDDKNGKNVGRPKKYEPKPDPEMVKTQAKQFEQFVSLMMEFYDGYIDSFRNGEVNKTMVKKWEALMDLSPIIFEKPLGKM